MNVPQNVIERWRSLESRAEYFFQTAAWVEVATAHVERAIAWNVTDIPGRGSFVAALGVRRFGSRLLHCVVLRDLRPVLEGPPLLDGLLNSAGGSRLRLQDVMPGFGRWHVVALRGLRRGSPWLQLAGSADSIAVEPDGGIGIFDTSAPFGQRWNSVPRRMRSNIRRARGRIGERGQIVVAAGAAVGDAFDEFVKLEATGWKGGEGTSLAQRPAERHVLREYLLSCDTAQVRSLLVDGRLAASEISVSVRSTRFGLKMAYDEEMSELAPGNVLLADLIETSCNDPEIDRIDCMTWQPRYAHWGMTREPTFKLTSFNSRSIWGLVGGLLWKSRSARSYLVAAVNSLRRYIATICMSA